MAPCPLLILPAATPSPALPPAPGPCPFCLPHIQIHARKHKMAADVDLYQLAKDLPGLSGGWHSEIVQLRCLFSLF